MNNTIATGALLRDPMTQDLWTPAMMAAWVLWRSPDKVAEYWFTHTRRRSERAPSLNDVLVWVEATERAEARAQGRTGYWEDLSPRVQKVVDELCDALENGRIGGLKTIPGTQQRISTTAGDWEGTDIGHRLGLASERLHDAIYAIGADIPRMVEVRVLRDDVLRQWPDPNATPVEAEAPVTEEIIKPAAVEAASVEQAVGQPTENYPNTAATGESTPNAKVELVTQEPEVPTSTVDTPAAEPIAETEAVPSPAGEAKPSEAEASPQAETPEVVSDTDRKAKAAARTAAARQKRSLHPERRLTFLRPHMGLLATPKGRAEFRRLSDKFQEDNDQKPLEKSAHKKDIATLRRFTEVEVTSVETNRNDRTTEVTGSHTRR